MHDCDMWYWFLKQILSEKLTNNYVFYVPPFEPYEGVCPAETELTSTVLFTVKFIDEAHESLDLRFLSMFYSTKL